MFDREPTDKEMEQGYIIEDLTDEINNLKGDIRKLIFVIEDNKYPHNMANLVNFILKRLKEII